MIRKIYSPQVNQLAQRRDQLRGHVKAMGSHNQRLDATAKAMRRGGMSGNESGCYDQMQLTDVPYWTAPGNVGDINTVIWPFYFATEFLEILPNTGGGGGSAVGSVSSSFSVTQEAAFIAMWFTKVVFLKTVIAGVTNYQYLDPDASAGGGKAVGLSVSFTESSSTRQLVNLTMNMDHIGSPRFPSLMPTPMLLLPLENFKTIYSNSGNDTFVAFITFFGYRIRIQDINNIQSTTSTPLAGSSV